MTALPGVLSQIQARIWRFPESFWLFVLLLSVYTVTMSGWIDSSDGQLMTRVTQSIVEDHSVSVPNERRYLGVLGPDGRKYAPTGLGISLVEVPFYLLGSALSQAFPDSLFSRGTFSSSTYMTEFVVQWLNPLAMALIGLMLYQILRELRCEPRAAALTVLVFAFATSAWPYSKHFFATPTATLLLQIATFGVLRFRSGLRPKWLILSGLAIGFALMTYISAGLSAAGVCACLLAILYTEWHGGRLSVSRGLVSLALFAGAVSIGLAGIGLFNWVRFGSLVETGYSASGSQLMMHTPLEFGLNGILLSSGKSIFLYSPPLILALLAWLRFARRQRAEALLVAVVVLANLGFYARLNAWHAEWNWGIRYMFPVLVFAMLPLGAWVNEMLSKRAKLERLALGVMALLGILVQLAGISVAYETYLARIPNSPFTVFYMYAYEAHFDPSWSPIAGHYRIMGNQFVGLTEAVTQHYSEGPRVFFGRGWGSLEFEGETPIRRAKGESYFYVERADPTSAVMRLDLIDNRRSDGKQTAVDVFVNGAKATGSPIVLPNGKWEEHSIPLPGTRLSEADRITVRLVVNPQLSQDKSGESAGLSLRNVRIGGEPVTGLASIAWGETSFDEKIGLVHRTFDFWWAKVFYSDLPDWLLVVPAMLAALAALCAVRLWMLFGGSEEPRFTAAHLP